MFGEYFCFSSKLFYFRCGRNIFLLHWREKEWRKVKIVGRGESAGGKKFSIVEEKSTALCPSYRKTRVFREAFVSLKSARVALRDGGLRKVVIVTS